MHFFSELTGRTDQTESDLGIFVSLVKMSKKPAKIITLEERGEGFGGKYLKKSIILKSI